MSSSGFNQVANTKSDLWNQCLCMAPEIFGRTRPHTRLPSVTLRRRVHLCQWRWKIPSVTAALCLVMVQCLRLVFAVLISRKVTRRDATSQSGIGTISLAKLYGRISLGNTAQSDTSRVSFDYSTSPPERPGLWPGVWIKSHAENPLRQGNSVALGSTYRGGAILAPHQC